MKETKLNEWGGPNIKEINFDMEADCRICEKP